MTLEDAIFNYLQIKHVAVNRPDDGAAQETFQFFQEILDEDFKLEDFKEELQDGMYIVRFIYEEAEQVKEYPAEFVQQLLLDIQSEPKFNE
ncbi:hypothetical protein [Caldalkalibacillus mannanilyticus]|uniref:hypothetical protein n=1 Tax=Caldalkalibacillus mannanilyticus TaxID=1418 RepID=UPI0004688ADE|nr:hypothetical protein [Caldalkalibacillus mannanilyticus]